METSFLDYVDTLAQMIVATAALIALRQLTITKKLARINARRESIKLAAEQCREFGEKVVPAMNALHRSIAEHNFRFLTESKIEVEGSQIKVKPFFDYPEHNAAASKVAHQVTPAYNALNAFALYFVSGVADERHAYATVGTSYCSSVKDMLPFIINWSNETRENNILRLFTLWNSRTEREADERKAAELTKKLEKNVAVEIRPIGT